MAFFLAVVWSVPAVLRTVKELLTTIKQRPGYYPNSLSPDTTKTELQHDAPNAIESWDNLASDAGRWASSMAASEQGNTPVASSYSGGVGKILDESSVCAHLLEGAFGAVEDLSCYLKQELSPVTFLGVPRQRGQGEHLTCLADKSQHLTCPADSQAVVSTVAHAVVAAVCGQVRPAVPSSQPMQEAPLSA